VPVIDFDNYCNNNFNSNAMENINRRQQYIVQQIQQQPPPQQSSNSNYNNNNNNNSQYFSQPFIGSNEQYFPGQYNTLSPQFQSFTGKVNEQNNHGYYGNMKRNFGAK
jgi:hypothetical protein